MAQLPIVMGPQGPIPTSPAVLRQQLIDLVSATNPDYTSNLPSSLIEDIVSTDVGALIISNQFMVDLINSVTPQGANPFILNQLGTIIYGLTLGTPVNTAVDVLFSGTPGFIIIPGFNITDGTFQYTCIDGGVIGTDGDSLPVHAVATVSGTWGVPVGTVTGLITSVPNTVTLTVTNPSDGIPSIASETIQSFRTRTLTAGLAASTGMDRYLKTLLQNIPGVVQRLVSVRQDIDNARWIILVGGGDPFQVAWAIYYALFDVSSLARPTIDIVNITKTNPIIITTEFNHNLVSGMTETINEVTGMVALNFNTYTVTVLTDKTFSIPVDGTSFPNYTGGGIVSPNPILQQIILNSYPDSYLIPFIIPAQQLVTMVITWQTDFNQYVSAQAMAQAAGPAIVDYVNSLFCGVSPINIYEMNAIFIDATSNILNSENLIYLNFAVSFDGVAQVPITNTGIIPGDPNSYFFPATNNIIVVQAP
jgi:hypothetical protein